MLVFMDTSLCCVISCAAMNTSGSQLGCYHGYETVLSSQLHCCHGNHSGILQLCWCHGYRTLQHCIRPQSSAPSI